MVLKNGQQLLFVANGLVFTKGKCILRVPEIIQKTVTQSQLRINNCKLILDYKGNHFDQHTNLR